MFKHPFLDKKKTILVEQIFLEINFWCLEKYCVYFISKIVPKTWLTFGKTVYLKLSNLCALSIILWYSSRFWINFFSRRFLMRSRCPVLRWISFLISALINSIFIFKITFYSKSILHFLASVHYVLYKLY